ncbi:MAG: hypothetical protein DRG30_06325 [Epsilonproteobacteria bacterium]|nr:MAG: hypothetical protein DRG30_06325 [Campylobacterota bacterium]
MKDLVIKKAFGKKGAYIITQEKGDIDNYSLKYFDEKLSILITIYVGGDTDGGSTGIAEIVFDELLGRTAHGYIFHDELWRHRVHLKDLYLQYGITFVETNRIMMNIHAKAGATWAETNLTRLAVRWLGWYKWIHPGDRVKSVSVPTITIEKVE